MFKKLQNAAKRTAQVCRNAADSVMSGAKHLAVAGAVGVGAMLGIPQAAEAALPVIVGTTLTSVQTDAIAMVDLVWPVVVTLFGALLLIKVFKRAGNKI